MFTAIKLKLKIERCTKRPRIRFDLKKLKDPKSAEMFQARVGGKFAALCIFDSDVDTLASSLKEGQLSTAEEVLWRQRKKIQPWVTNEVLDLYTQTWQLKQQKFTSIEAGLEYRKVNREAKKTMKAEKEEETGKQLSLIHI